MHVILVNLVNLTNVTFSIHGIYQQFNYIMLAWDLTEESRAIVKCSFSLIAQTWTRVLKEPNTTGTFSGRFSEIKQGRREPKEISQG